MTLPLWLNDENIIKLIREHSSIKKDKKAKNGEVFTPIELICDLLDKMPIDVWKNPHLKWLDPANGNGNILIVVYYKLMEELKCIEGYKDTSVRSKHIIENMLFMIELNPECIELCKILFKKINADAKLNIVCADFLNKQEETIWKEEFFQKKNIPVNLFDIIIGNPPYNIDGIKHKGKKNVYVFFALKGLELLKPGGYLAYIHPPTYRIPNHKIQHTRINLNSIYTNKCIICIKMFSINATKKMMNVMMNVDYIILKNIENNKINESTIIDVNSKEYRHIIYPNDFIPNYGLPILKKMKNKTVERGSLELILTSEMHAQLITGTTYKNIHGIKKKGIKICCSKKQHSLQNKRKLIINGIGSYNYVFYDEQGEYGFTQSPLAICEPSTNTLQLIQSKLFHYLADATKIIGNNFNIQTSLFLPLIPSSMTITNVEDLYDYFGFTLEQRKEIEKWAIPEYTKCELLCD